MEAYKGDSLRSIFQSMGILSEFPKQVVVLKGTQRACTMRGRKSGLQRRLIDEDQSRGFPRFCTQLRAAMGGDERLRQEILEHGRAATAHIDGRVLRDAKEIPNIFSGSANLYTPTELKIIRTHQQHTAEMREKHALGILRVAANLFRDHPAVTHLPSPDELPYTFIFRFTVCAYVLFLRWIADGSQRNTRVNKLRNDMVDLNFAAFATFFDGLLTADKKLTEIYEGTMAILKTGFGVATP